MDNSDPQLTPVQKFGEAMADRVERWMPSPFVFAILLTYVAAVAAFVSEGSSIADVATAWYGGFWNIPEPPEPPFSGGSGCGVSASIASIALQEVSWPS